MSQSPPWYYMRDLPGGRVHVRVLWEGREFAAARVVHPRTGRLTWCLPTRPGEEPQWLPRRADAGRWAPSPERWQPLDATAWTWPNGIAATPAPELIVPRMYAGDGTRTWASAVEQAQSARTEDELRSSGASAGCESAAPRKIGTRWWHDRARIVYAADGAPVSIEDAEGRVCRAVLTDGLRSIEGPQRWQGGTGSALEKYQHEVVSSEHADAPRFEPERADIDDYEHGPPMRWFAVLAPPPAVRRARAPLWQLDAAQSIILLHAHGFSWRQAGRQLGVSAQRAQEMYRGGERNVGAIEKVWRAANGIDLYPWLPASARDPLAALRERNRAAKRADHDGMI